MYDLVFQVWAKVWPESHGGVWGAQSFRRSPSHSSHPSSATALPFGSFQRSTSWGVAENTCSSECQSFDSSWLCGKPVCATCRMLSSIMSKVSVVQICSNVKGKISILRHAMTCPHIILKLMHPITSHRTSHRRHRISRTVLGDHPLNCEHQTCLKPPTSLHWPEELSTMGQNSGTLGILKYLVNG